MMSPTNNVNCQKSRYNVTQPEERSEFQKRPPKRRAHGSSPLTCTSVNLSIDSGDQTPLAQRERERAERFCTRRHSSTQNKKRKVITRLKEMTANQ
ncbi:hypothetical protein CDAR_586431 [Caerostris darwini]|uniref:Uncharacterized protein n=1 Tax=Caerostris darwini TaxID=1538125 RepID=A0AAV4QA69_9ARAC|nr:hypothetical protein CDAR_586431 [Caerostris darwini]